jgi:dihydroorotase
MTGRTLVKAAQWDLLLKGGRVIDPKNGVDRTGDVAIRDGKIAAVGANLREAEARQTLDVCGLVITPGLVDIHVHLFHTTGVHDAWAGDNSVRPDDFSFRAGVTTMADAGSAGWRDFEEFRLRVIDRAKTRVLAFVNIAGHGMMTNWMEQNEAEMIPSELARVGRKHADVVVGVKTAHWEAPSWTAVDKALEAGRLLGKPVMVDFGYFRKERPFWQLVTEKLRPGDIATHCYRATVPWVCGNGKVYEYLKRARERGVRFDVGHGGGSFAFRNAVPAIRQGFWPDSISSDLHTTSMNAAMMDLPTTMSKFLAMGMGLSEVVARATHSAAALIGHEGLGTLSEGAEADVAGLRVMAGDFGFADTDRGVLRGRERLFCELTLRAGQVTWDWNARSGVDYQKLGKDYGVREGEFVIPPPK